MLLFDNVSVQMIQSAVVLGAIGPATVVKTFDLIVPPPGPLMDCRSWKGDRGRSCSGSKVRKDFGPYSKPGSKCLGAPTGVGLNVNSRIDGAYGTR